MVSQNGVNDAQIIKRLGDAYSVMTVLKSVKGFLKAGDGRRKIALRHVDF